MSRENINLDSLLSVPPEQLLVYTDTVPVVWLTRYLDAQLANQKQELLDTLDLQLAALVESTLLSIIHTPELGKGLRHVIDSKLLALHRCDKIHKYLTALPTEDPHLTTLIKLMKELD